MEVNIEEKKERRRTKMEEVDEGQGEGGREQGNS